MIKQHQCRMSPVPVAHGQVTRQTRRAALSAGRLTIPKAMAYFAGEPRKPQEGQMYHMMPVIISSDISCGHCFLDFIPTRRFV